MIRQNIVKLKEGAVTNLKKNAYRELFSALSFALASLGSSLHEAIDLRVMDKFAGDVSGEKFFMLSSS